MTTQVTMKTTCHMIISMAIMILKFRNIWKSFDILVNVGLITYLPTTISKLWRVKPSQLKSEILCLEFVCILLCKMHIINFVNPGIGNTRSQRRWGWVQWLHLVAVLTWPVPHISHKLHMSTTLCRSPTSHYVSPVPPVPWKVLN